MPAATRAAWPSNLPLQLSIKFHHPHATSVAKLRGAHATGSACTHCLLSCTDQFIRDILPALQEAAHEVGQAVKEDAASAKDAVVDAAGKARDAAQVRPPLTLYWILAGTLGGMQAGCLAGWLAGGRAGGQADRD